MPTLTITRPQVDLRSQAVEQWLVQCHPNAVVGYAREGDRSVLGKYLTDVGGLPVVFVDGKKALLAGDGSIELPAWARQFDYQLDQLDAGAERPIPAGEALAILKELALIRWLESLELDERLAQERAIP